jgi:hypothetical protein
MDASALRRRLAALGIGLFERAQTVTRPTPTQYADLVEGLAASDDPRLVASTACLALLHDRDAPAAVETAGARLDPSARLRLGLVYRLARALAVSREPDIVHVLGRRRHPAPVSFEPADLPDPADDMGERCVSVARDAHDRDAGGNLVGDVEDLVDAWLATAAVDGLAATDA